MRIIQSFESVHFNYLKISLDDENNFEIESYINKKVEADRNIDPNYIIEKYHEYMNKKIKLLIKKNPVMVDSISKLIKLRLQSIERINKSYENLNKEEKKDDSGKLLMKLGNLINKIEPQIMSLIDLIQDRDIVRHLKNSNFDFQKFNTVLDLKYDINKKRDESKIALHEFMENNFFDKKSYHTLERLDDKINEIVLTQKTKKYIQKTFSERYKFLINNETFELMKEIVMKDVSRRDFHSDFSNKIARYNDPVEFNDDLKKYIQSSQGWSLEHYKRIANTNDIEIHYEKDNKMCVRVDTYKQSEEIGSKQWCISYDNGYFDTYREDGLLFFVFDFNKEINDNTCMLGMKIDDEGLIEDAYWKNDEEVESMSQEVDNNSGFDGYVKLIPELLKSGIFAKSDNIYFESMSNKGKTKYLLEKCITLEGSNDIKKNIENGIIENIPREIFLKMIAMSKTEIISEDNARFEHKDEYQKLRDNWKDTVNCILNKDIVYLSDVKVSQSILELEDKTITKSYLKILTKHTDAIYDKSAKLLNLSSQSSVSNGRFMKTQVGINLTKRNISHIDEFYKSKIKPKHK